MKCHTPTVQHVSEKKRPVIHVEFKFSQQKNISNNIKRLFEKAFAILVYPLSDFTLYFKSVQRVFKETLK